MLNKKRKGKERHTMNRDSSGEERQWDPSAPGAGALRAASLIQLYFRMANYTPLTILIVDALCLVFGADGATIHAMVGYLGISEDRIRHGIDTIPPDMRCTSLQLEEMVGAPAEEKEDGESYPRDGASGRADLRYYLNYKRALPIIYAHLTYMLLAACVSDVPPCSYVDQLKRAQLAQFDKSSSQTAHVFFSRNGSEAESNSVDGGSSLTTAGGTGASGTAAQQIDISNVMQRKGELRGIYCFDCSSYFALEEFAASLSRCPRCGADVLHRYIHAIRDEAAETGICNIPETLATLLPPVRQVWKREAAQYAVAVNTSETSTSVEGPFPRPRRASSEHLQCPLARDPFLLQQSLAFLFLFSSKFASATDVACVVDVQEILTEAEYRGRLRGKASIADFFRARHRNAASVRVKMVTQRDVDLAKRRESERKLRKRAMLPPWLTHKRSGATEVVCGTFDAMEGLLAPSPSVTAKLPIPARSPELASKAAGCEKKEAVKKLSPSSSKVKDEDFLLTARFVVEEFYEDDFEEVQLSSNRRLRPLPV